MNMRINQNTWEVFSPKVEQSQELKNKQDAVGFGKALANSLKSANKTGNQQKPHGSRLNEPREIKSQVNQTIVCTKPITLNNQPKEQLSITDGDRKVAATHEEVSVVKPQELSVDTESELTKQTANLEQQSWWLEFMGLLNMFAKLGGMEESDLETINCLIAESCGQVVPASRSPEQGVLLTQLTGQEQAVQMSLQQLNLANSSDLSAQVASFPGMNNLAILSLVNTGLNQTEGNEDAQLVQSRVLEKNQGELQKLAASLKPILEQLLQGKVTIAAAAATILSDNGLMEQIAVQVKLLKLQLINNTQSVDLETTVPDPPQEVVVQPKLTENLTQVSPEKTIKVTTGNKLPEVALEVASEDAPEVIRESKSFHGGSESPREVTAVTTLLSAEPIFTELPEQLWAFQSTPQKDGTALELAVAVKNQIPRMAREIVSQMVFKQIVDNSQMIIGKDHSEIKIQLKPEFLGKVSLEVSIEKGVVKAEIVAENQQVKQLIEANLGNLRQTLTNQGLKVDQLVVNLGGQSQFGQTKEQGQNTGRGTRKPQNTEEIFEIGVISGEYGLDLEEANQVVDYKI